MYLGIIPICFPRLFWEGVGTEYDSDTDGLEEPSVGSDPFCKHFCIVAVPNVNHVLGE